MARMMTEAELLLTRRFEAKESVGKQVLCKTPDGEVIEYAHACDVDERWVSIWPTWEPEPGVGRIRVDRVKHALLECHFIDFDVVMKDGGVVLHRVRQTCSTCGQAFKKRPLFTGTYFGCAC